MTNEDSYSTPVIGAVTAYGPPEPPQSPQRNWDLEPDVRHVVSLLQMAAKAMKMAAENHRGLRGTLPVERYESVRLAYEDITDYGAQLLNRELRRRSGEVVHGTKFEDWNDVFGPDVPELTAIYEETDR